MPCWLVDTFLDIQCPPGRSRFSRQLGAPFLIGIILADQCPPGYRLRPSGCYHHLSRHPPPEHVLLSWPLPPSRPLGASWMVGSRRISECLVPFCQLCAQLPACAVGTYCSAPIWLLWLRPPWLSDILLVTDALLDAGHSSRFLVPCYSFGVILATWRSRGHSAHP